MNILEKILTTKYKEIEAEKELSGLSLSEIKKKATHKNSQKNANSFISYIKTRPEKMSLIAEIKKASPSKGIIKENFNHIDIAKDYIEADVGAMSILTDEKFFQGSKDYLLEIRELTSKPILRKDFIVDEFQVYQSRIMGADMLLLIVAALKPDELKKLYYEAKEVGFDVLIETHDEYEFEQAMNLEAKLIGVNNRNLKTFDTNISTTLRLIEEFKPKDRFIISESGISTNEDILILKAAGASGVLVGETFMRSNDTQSKIKYLLGELK